MTFTTIALVVFLKGVLVALLVKFGKFKTHAQRAEERKVLLAYREWRKSSGTRPSADAGVVADRIPNRHR